MAKLRPHERLAVEIAVEEAIEELAAADLEGLRDAWAEAEELAAISDQLLLPKQVDRVLGALRREAAPGSRDRPEANP